MVSMTLHILGVPGYQQLSDAMGICLSFPNPHLFLNDHSPPQLSLQTPSHSVTAAQKHHPSFMLYIC